MNIKQTDDWIEFLTFLENYFKNHRKSRRQSSDEDSRAIPGGRYGCVQFIKLCGPSCLRQCSLGKLSYMVQLAINEDILRYHRTLLVWTSDHQTDTPEDEFQKKVKSVQKAIITLLTRNYEGISLAQLPLFLKRMLPFNLNISELGFAKLKDLLATIPEVIVELRGNNHPFAILKRAQKCNYVDEISQINDFLISILDDNPTGLSESKLESILISRMGHQVE